MKKLFTLSLAVMLSMLFSSVASAKQLYVVGDGVFGGWNPGSPKAMTLAADGITNTMDIALDGATYWAVCDGADSNWNTFNSTYRWSYKSGSKTDVGIGEYQLAKNGDVAMKLSAGEYHISINSETMYMTITGKKEDLVISVMSVVGPLVGGWPNGDDWRVACDMNKVSDTQWTLTLTNRLLNHGNYEWKVTANHKWGELELPSSGNFNQRIDEPGYYTLTFNVDISGEDPTATVDILKTAEATEDDFVTSYYMVGNNEAIFGTTWDPYNTANKMEQSTEDEDIYVKTYNNVTLSAGSVKYQAVCRDNTGSLSWEYPGQDKELEIEEDGVYNITFMLYVSMFDFDDPIVTKGEGQSTNIRNIEIKKSNAAIYNLNGQRVSNPAKGIYILNGRKYAVK